MPNKKYKVLKDNKEKNGSWDFHENDYCLGTEVIHLPTGDYTLEGLEESFIIERKRSTSEIALNINESRFEKEFERLELFKNPFIICEFTLEDIYSFPLNSGIPEKFWGKLVVTSKRLLSVVLDLQMKFKTKWIFGGQNSQDIAKLLMYKAVKC